MLSSLLVFDIETIPDTDSCDSLVGRAVGGDVAAKREAMADYHLEVTNGQNPFLRAVSQDSDNKLSQSGYTARSGV